MATCTNGVARTYAGKGGVRVSWNAGPFRRRRGQGGERNLFTHNTAGKILPE